MGEFNRKLTLGLNTRQLIRMRRFKEVLMTPYSNLPERNFWSPAVGKRQAMDIDALWVPKWPVTPRTKVVTFGSCFA